MSWDLTNEQSNEKDLISDFTDTTTFQLFRGKKYDEKSFEIHLQHITQFNDEFSLEIPRTNAQVYLNNADEELEFLVESRPLFRDVFSPKFSVPMSQQFIFKNGDFEKIATDSMPSKNMLQTAEFLNNNSEKFSLLALFKSPGYAVGDAYLTFKKPSTNSPAQGMLKLMLSFSRRFNTDDFKSSNPSKPPASAYSIAVAKVFVKSRTLPIVVNDDNPLKKIAVKPLSLLDHIQNTLGAHV